jgi:Asp-tRNA(Asn)/Glu-tRNA(Gln) amidotransferase A subunit family amidase
MHELLLVSAIEQAARVRSGEVSARELVEASLAAIDRIDPPARFSALVRLWNMTGQPAISLPLHETADGEAVGVQLVGPPGREDLLLALANQLENAAGRRPRLPAPIADVSAQNRG